MPTPDGKRRLDRGFEGFVKDCLLVHLFKKRSYFEQSKLSNLSEGYKELPSPDATRHPLPREGKFVIQRTKSEESHDEELVIQKVKPEESYDKEVLHSAQDDEKISLAPMREREELLSKRSELSNSGEGCKDLPSPVAFATQSPKCRKTRHFDKMLKQVHHDDFSCAKHTVKNLLPNRPIVLTTLKKCAFTLAEVLITLGIIGVVAAVTLPTLVQNYKKTVYVNQLKKFVSTFEQGLQKMLADEGVQRLSDLPGLGTNYNAWDQKEEALKFIEDFLSKGFYVTYKDAQGYLLSDWGWTHEDGYTNHIQLNDGSAIIELHSQGKNASHESSAQCDLIKSKGGTMCSYFMSFHVDVNGVKGPNKEGRDVFFFQVSDEGKLYPSGGKDFALYSHPSSPLESNVSYWNSSSADGYTGCDGNTKMGGCAARIIENGWKMDY